MAMEAQPSRHLTERELRTLSTAELLDLIQQDIRDLDRVWRQRKKAAQLANTHAKPSPPAKEKDRLAEILAELAAHQPPEELATFHRVTCCGAHMGDFPPMARVRCPFCEQWHRAGDFPERD